MWQLVCVAAFQIFRWILSLCISVGMAVAHLSKVIWKDLPSICSCVRAAVFFYYLVVAVALRLFISFFPLRLRKTLIILPVKLIHFRCSSVNFQRFVRRIFGLCWGGEWAWVWAMKMYFSCLRCSSVEWLGCRAEILGIVLVHKHEPNLLIKQTALFACCCLPLLIISLFSLVFFRNNLLFLFTSLPMKIAQHKKRIKKNKKNKLETTERVFSWWQWAWQMWQRHRMKKKTL